MLVGADIRGPQIKILAREVRCGKMPWWNPSIHSDMLLIQEKPLPNIKDNAGGGEAAWKQEDNMVITDLCAPGTQPPDFIFAAVGKVVLNYAGSS